MLDPTRLNRLKLYFYQDKLNEIKTYSQFASLQAIAWDQGYDQEFACAIDISGIAPTRAVMRDWLEGIVTTEDVPQPSCEYIDPKEARRLRNVAKNT